MSKVLNSYTLLDEISKSIYLDTDDKIEILKRLKRKSNTLKKSILTDFEYLFDEQFKITETHFFYNDNSYRQNATGCMMNAELIKSKEFQFIIEFLIDHNKILIKSKNTSKILESNKIVNQIIKEYGLEDCCELNQIKTHYDKSFWQTIKINIKHIFKNSTSI